MATARFLLPLSLLLSIAAQAQLSADIARIAAQAHGRVGVACSLPGRTIDCEFRPMQWFPMQSVYKLPIVMAALHAVEQGRFRLDQNIRFLPSDLISHDQYSPLRDAHPHGNADVPVNELMRLAVQESDGVASDILLRALGGPAAADAYVRSLGIDGIHIVDTEKSLGRDVKLEDRDSAQPRALVTLLRRLVDRSPLSPEHTQLLLGWMTASHTGDNRIKAQLPPGTIIAGKTGTSGTGRDFTNATNDIALITLPSGQKLAVAILVADSSAPAAVRERVIAEIARAVYSAAAH
ncbi:MAG: class A beta-lactamase [Acidobacteriaceae bacterium]